MKRPSATLRRMNREAIVISAAFFSSLVPGDPPKSFTLPWTLPANAVLLGYQIKGGYTFPAPTGAMTLQLATPLQAPPSPLSLPNGNNVLATGSLFTSTRTPKSVTVLASGDPPSGGSVTIDLIWEALTTTTVNA